MPAHSFLIHMHFALLFGMAALAQDLTEPLPSGQPGQFVLTLPLAETMRATLLEAIGKRQYHAAEELLAEEAKKDPKSQPLLLALANVLFLDGKQLNSALVLKKAELLGPLDERNRFLLALSYIALSRKSLAIQELESLQQSNPSNAVYPYWLSRLTYRQLDLQRALTNAETAVRLDPKFMKAYDQLGLCYSGLNQNDEAIQAFTEAIQLNQGQALRSPWPSMNLGTLLLRLERLDEAESRLRDSVSINSRFPTAHLRLGQVLEKKERLDEAMAELNEAARLDPTYPEPHYALARIYRKRHNQEKAETELNLFQQLRNVDKAKGITRPD
jgi:tetratricopeptide (TPR) repeat protein